VSAVLIVTVVGAGAIFMIGLISSPLMEWSTRLPDWAPAAGKTACVRSAAGLWRQLQSMLGGSDSLSAVPFEVPKLDWVQPTFEFLSPTFTEFLLFLATLSCSLRAGRTCDAR